MHEDGARDTLEARLRVDVARAVGLEPGQLDVTKPIFDYGLDSLTSVTLLGEIEQELGVELPIELLWEHTSVAELAAAIERHAADSAR